MNGPRVTVLLEGSHTAVGCGFEGGGAVWACVMHVRAVMMPRSADEAFACNDPSGRVHTAAEKLFRTSCVCHTRVVAACACVCLQVCVLEVCEGGG